MGTSYAIKIALEPGTSFEREKVESEIDSLLQAINMQMSTYIEESELSTLNNYEKDDWLEVSGELLTVIEQSRKISEMTDGAFDITVGPLVNLWGFGPEETGRIVPNMTEIQRRMRFVGYRKLSLRGTPPSIKKERPELYCDLSAIAKGYGVDRVAELLDDLGFYNYLVEIGGEVRAKGLNHLHKNWRIGVSAPDETWSIHKVVSVSNTSLATSGDYRNYYEEYGVRYSHTIDPRTGGPVTHDLASVTVIHPSCMIADGWATALTVLGPDQGYELALERELAVYMLVKAKKNFLEKMTPEFEKILKASS
jgi:thiamine biosynthesis lipoprotein